MNLAACTYSRSRSDSVSPRTTRPVTIQPNSESSSTSHSQLLPDSTGLRIARIRKPGSTSSRSMTHTSDRSI